MFVIRVFNNLITYFTHTFKGFIIFSACSLLDTAHAANCSHYDGVWSNHSCVLPGDLEFEGLRNATSELSLTNTDTDTEMEVKSPADEYFQ